MSRANAKPIIRTSNLSKSYGDVQAVKKLNLEIYPGEIFGLLGPNGAGKTTTTLMLLGLTDPTSGHAAIDGKDCTRNSLEVKNEVGYLPDKVGFYPSVTGRDNLIFSGMMNGLPRKEAEQRADELMERVGIAYAGDRKAGTYSRGMRQRLGIADVLMKRPKIIIMDEPTSGIDPQGTHELTKLIRELADRDGLTILISSHDLYQIQAISDRVGIFVKGKMIACGKIDELSAQLRSEGLYIFDFKVERNGENIWTDEFQKSIRSIPGVRLIGKKVDGSIHVEANRDMQKELTKLLVEQDYVIREMHQSGGDLEEIYRRYFEQAEREGGENRGGSKDAKQKRFGRDKAKLEEVH